MKKPSERINEIWQQKAGTNTKVTQTHSNTAIEIIIEYLDEQYEAEQKALKELAGKILPMGVVENN